MPTFKQDDDVLFWPPTFQYFFEAPFRVHEGQLIAYVGAKKVAGKLYDRVFVTWKSFKPVESMDQYIVWINRETGRMDYLTFTARDVFDFITGAAIYTDYQKVGEVWVPGKITIAEGIDDGDRDDIVHVLTVESLTFGVDVPERFLIPRPELRGKK